MIPLTDPAERQPPALRYAMRKTRHAPLKRAFILLWFVWAARSALAQESKFLAETFRAIRGGQIRVVDLTHDLDGQSPYWPEGGTQSPFRATVVANIEHGGYFARTLAIPEHFGTHMDAPAHFDTRGLTVDRIPPGKLLAAAVVVDVRQRVKSQPDYRVRVEDLEAWRKAHGAFPRGCVVFFRTGWGARWPSQQRTMNQDAQGVLHFPGLSPEAAHYLLDRVRPVAIGIDTPSIDYGPSKNFEVHRLTMAAGLYHLENVANLEQLPAAGAYVIALPLKLRGGSGSPTRVLALDPSADANPTRPSAAP